jgi:carboxylesterase type B
MGKLMMPIRYVHHTPQAESANRTKHGPVCHATPSTALDSSRSEDCLYLDVYAPSDNKGNHPVYVYFLGGGFNELSSPNKNGGPLIVAADMDMVVVTFNYRVGVYGFLSGKEVQANGTLNAGLMDQRKVLQWIQQHISKVITPTTFQSSFSY